MLNAESCAILYKHKICNSPLNHLHYKRDKETSKVDAISHMAKDNISHSIQLNSGSDERSNQADLYHDIECTSEPEPDQHTEKTN